MNVQKCSNGIGNGTGNTRDTMLRAEYSSSFHPVLISETEAESRSSFQQEPPTGWGIAFKEFKCAAWPTRLYSIGRVWDPVPHAGFTVFFLGREIIRQRFSPTGGGTAQCVKWVQTLYILTHELCWVPCGDVSAKCSYRFPIMYLEHLINLIWRNGVYI